MSQNTNPDNYSTRIIADNEACLQELAWAIEMSQGQFSLMLARCNYVNFRESLAQRLREICSCEIREIVLSASTQKLYTAVKESLGDEQPPGALMISGLESVDNIDHLLTSMNQVREEFRKNYAFPLIIWINDEISRRLIRLAPDFQSWTTLNEFIIAPETLSIYLNEQIDALFAKVLDVGSQILPNSIFLDFERVGEIPTALRNLAGQNCELSPYLQANLEFVFGRNAYIKNQIDQALEIYQRSLTFWQDSQNYLRQGLLLFEIGCCHYRLAELESRENQQHWQVAQTYFQDCVDVFQQLDRLDLVAKFISYLTGVLHKLKDWENLASLIVKSQHLHEIYGTTVQLAEDYGFLAEIALHKQQPDLAQDMSLKALQILATANEAENQLHQGLYFLLLARSSRQLGQIELAILSLERARNTHLQNHPLLYIQILEELRSLYFEEHRYLEAFQVKQVRRSIEQQFGLQSFIGAGRLQPKIRVSSDLTPSLPQETIASEILTSGRQRDVERLIERIGSTQYKLTVIHGQSGVGKSSLLGAGLVPALKLQNIGTYDVLPILIRVYTDWIKELGKLLAAALVGQNIFLLTIPESTNAIITQLVENQQRNLLTVLIFDQFEEFFFVYDQPSKRQQFFDFLGDCLNIPVVKIVLSMREDYLHYLLICNRLPKMAAINQDILNKNVLYPLGNFLPEDAKHFILGCAKMNLEPALVDELIQDLAGSSQEVRLIELQVVGAQMQTENITTLAQYRQLGPKDKLVQRYLEEIVQDCGIENQRTANSLLYLLTDEQNTRPLKTQAELEKDLKAIATDSFTESEKLNLVLQVFVESGLVYLLPETPTHRYQLVHDYLVDFIRRQQEPKLKKLAAELANEKRERQLSQDQLNVIEQANQILIQSQAIAKKEPPKRKIWEIWSILAGSVSVAGLITIMRLFGSLQFWELHNLDLWFNLRPEEPSDQRILIVGIDEADIAKVGKWPLPDRLLGQLLQKIAAQKPRAIGLDLYRNLPVDPGHAELEKVMQTIPNLIGVESIQEKIYPPPILKKLNQFGIDDVVLDIDHTLRRTILAIPDDHDQTVPAFSMVLANTYLNAEKIPHKKVENQDQNTIQLGGYAFHRFKSNDGGYVNADDGGYQILLNYRKSAQGFSKVSLTDMLTGHLPSNFQSHGLANRIVLIGLTAPSIIKDYVDTPYKTHFYHIPEVEYQSQAISQILSSVLNGRSGINILPSSIEKLLIWVFCGLGTAMAWCLRSWLKLSALLFLAVFGLIITCYTAFLYSWWLPLIPSVLSLMGGATITAIITHNQLEKLHFRRTLELIFLECRTNASAGQRAVEYFMVAYRGTKLADSVLIGLIIDTLKACDTPQDISEISDKLAWISSLLPKNVNLILTKFWETSQNLQIFFQISSLHANTILLNSSITILRHIQENNDYQIRAYQRKALQNIAKQWLNTLEKLSVEN